jgi:sialidase-1
LKNGPWAGRLVAGVHHIERENNGCYIGAVYSDDGGLSWRHGEPLLSLAGGNESVVAELPSGELLINARNRDHNAGANWENENFRIVARSRDGGRSWVEARRDTALVEPACHASLLAIENPGFPEGLLLFSNPPDSTYRENLSVRASLDGGRSWPWKRRLFEGPSAYSSLVDLGSGRAGCLFECGAAWAHEGIAFRMFDYAEALQ